jgi:hypothetical protein
LTCLVCIYCIKICVSYNKEKSIKYNIRKARILGLSQRQHLRYKIRAVWITELQKTNEQSHPDVTLKGNVWNTVKPYDVR